MDYDVIEEMVSYRKNVTGIGNTIFISPRGNARHGPRVKIAIDPPDSLDPRGTTVSMAFDGTIIGDLDSQLVRQVQQFIEMNRGVLLDYWHYRIDTDQLRQRLIAIR